MEKWILFTVLMVVAGALFQAPFLIDFYFQANDVLVRSAMDFIWPLALAISLFLSEKLVLFSHFMHYVSCFLCSAQLMILNFTGARDNENIIIRRWVTSLSSSFMIPAAIITSFFLKGKSQNVANANHVRAFLASLFLAFIGYTFFDYIMSSTMWADKVINNFETYIGLLVPSLLSGICLGLIAWTIKEEGILPSLQWISIFSFFLTLINIHYFFKKIQDLTPKQVVSVLYLLPINAIWKLAPLFSFTTLRGSESLMLFTGGAVLVVSLVEMIIERKFPEFMFWFFLVVLTGTYVIFQFDERKNKEIQHQQTAGKNLV